MQAVKIPGGVIVVIIGNFAATWWLTVAATEKEPCLDNLHLHTEARRRSSLACENSIPVFSCALLRSTTAQYHGASVNIVQDLQDEKQEQCLHFVPVGWLISKAI